MKKKIKQEVLEKFKEWCKEQRFHFLPSKWSREDNVIIDLTIQKTISEIFKEIEKHLKDLLFFEDNELRNELEGFIDLKLEELKKKMIK